MLKKISFCFGVMASLSLNAWAKLSVAPQYVLFDKNSPKVQMVNVINNDDKPQTFNVKLLHYKHNEDCCYS